MQSQGRLDVLDGVRGMAALWVVLGHLWGMYYSTVAGNLGLATNWLAYPHFAVDIFIVLSGFCLILPTISTGSLRGSVGQFYCRRALRILPPLYACLAISFLVAWIISRYSQHAEAISIPVIATNLLLMQDWVPQLNRINAVTWSVALECKIYLLFPLLLFFQRRIGWPWTIGISAASGYGLLVAALWSVPTLDMSRACPWYLFLFTLGCAAGHYSHNSSTRMHQSVACGLLGLSSAIVLLLTQFYPIDSKVPEAEPIEDAFVGIAAASGLFLLSTNSASPIACGFRSRAIVFVGTCSYSLYLIHLPLLQISRILVNRLPFVPASSASRICAVAAIGLPMVSVGTYMFFNLIERPFLNWRRSNKEQDIVMAAAISPAP